jgi:hypothetical protein
MWWDSFIGFGTSATAIAITYPADTVSRRMQVSNRGTSGLFGRGLYKGLGPALITQPCYWAINLPAYNMLRQQLSGTELYDNGVYLFF